MALGTLSISNLRNIVRADLALSPKLNFFFGNNGSGKTSVLESVYLLAMGRSFRTRLINRLIHYGLDSLSIHGTLFHDQTSIGLKKSLREKTLIRIDHETQSGMRKLIEILPIQFLNPESHTLLEEGPKTRRQFLDWGTFHVERRFLDVWNKLARIIKQRNISIKQNLSDSEIRVWDRDLVFLSEELSILRKAYLSEFIPVFEDTLSILLPEIASVKLDFFPGWSETVDFHDLLGRTFYRDKALGYTTLGGHKADLRIFVHDLPVSDVLSRGQQKLFVFAMRIAQGRLFFNKSQKAPIYLIDDLAAELDSEKQKSILGLIKSLSGQVFITGVEVKKSFEEEFFDFASLFHVKQGHIYASESFV